MQCQKYCPHAAESGNVSGHLLDCMGYRYSSITLLFDSGSMCATPAILGGMVENRGGKIAFA